MMDTAKEKTMIVHLKEKQVKFSQMPGRLYIRNPKFKEKEHQNKISTSKQNCFTIKENTQYISNRHLKRAQDIKRLQNTLGMPSYKDLKAIITMNIIKDNQISHYDINLAENVFDKPRGEIRNTKIIKLSIFQKN